MPFQKIKAAQLQQLHQGPRILVLPNAWDAASARIFEAAGFPAVATTSAGVANALGYADGQIAPRSDILFMIRRIARTVRIPVTADIEAGFGNSVKEVLETVRGVMAAGCVGINLEDSTAGEASALFPMEEQIQKIQAIRALADAKGVPLVINARTDAFQIPDLTPSARFDLAVARANVYRVAGADCLFVPFVTEAATIARLAQAINGPLNILAMPGAPAVAELERLGVARVSVGSGPHRATLALARRIALELRDQGSYDAFMQETIPYAEVNRLFTETG